jgi:hypothetical protein
MDAQPVWSLGIVVQRSEIATMCAGFLPVPLISMVQVRWNVPKEIACSLINKRLRAAPLRNPADT